MSKQKVLVVEDEIIIAMDIRNSLRSMGYEVPAIASSGEKALEKVAELQPDLVLMDIILKGKMDGVETATKIRKDFNIPVVYLTAHSDVYTLNRAKATGPFGYVVKPFEMRDLQTTIDIAIARSQAEDEMRKAIEKEKELSELKIRFVTMVSHEFRTPLSTILFSAGLLEKYRNKWSEEKKTTHLERIQTAVLHMTKLLEDVLLIGKAEAAQIKLKPESMDLEKFCREMVEEEQERSLNKLQVKLNTTAGELTEVEMDEKLLRHILSNLLSNAVKYSQEDSVVEFELASKDGEAWFRIQDRGIGIPVADREHLFEMFHRGTNVGTIQGTGLGLAIVKRAVDLHGGEITVESEEEVGTTFLVRLPLHRKIDDFNISD
ncbi:MAG: ATP-binding protein [Hormoscilla sp.]